jgi:hypothetical protein
MAKAAKRKSRQKRPVQPRHALAQAGPAAEPAAPTAEIERAVSTKEPLPPSPERSIFPYVISVLLVLPSVYWVLKDKAVWPWDQAWYAEVSVDLWYLLTHHPGEWPAAMINAFGSKAPGVAWIGQLFVPLGQAAGSIEFGLMLSILAAHLGTLLLMYQIGLELSSRSRPIALFGMLFAASAPLSAAMAHECFVETLQAFAVTYIFWIAAVAHKLNRLRLLAHLLIATSVALLAKSTSPLYCGLAGAIAVYSFFRANSWVNDARDRAKSLALLFVGSSLAAGTLLWYARNFQEVVAYAKLGTIGSVVHDYGTVGTFQSKLLYWLRAIHLNFFFPFAAPALLLLMFAGFCLALKYGYRARKRANLLAAAALMHVAAVLAVFSSQVSEEHRYLLPVLTCIAICLMWALSLSSRSYLGTLACVVVAIQFLVTTAQALNLRKADPNVSYWLKPYSSDTASRGELSKLIRLTSLPGTESRYNIVGVELPWLNANSLAFYAAKGRLETGRRSYFTPLGYAETDVERAWTRLNQLRIMYFVSIEEDKQPRPPNFLNRVTLPILRRVVSDPDFAPVDFPSRLGILLFRRIDGHVGRVQAPASEEREVR